MDLLINYVESAMKKIQVEYLDALLIHWPVPEYMDKTWNCFMDLKKNGVVRYIGICNYRMRQIENIKNDETDPDIIQLERNPLRTCDKESNYMQQHNIIAQSYSPLCKMHPDIAKSIQLEEIAKRYNKNIGQIVLRWHIDTGFIPIFTSKKQSRIKEYSELFDFSLSREDIEIISSLNKDYKMYLEACACPGF